MSNLVPGVLLHPFAIAVLLALPISLVVLAWYRRAVLRSMRERGSTGADTPRVAPMAVARTAQAQATAPPPDQLRLRMRLVVVYTLAAIAVSDEAILESQQQLARAEGIFAAPEGAATLAALKELIRLNWVRPDERIVLFNTGSGLKYLNPAGLVG